MVKVNILNLLFLILILLIAIPLSLLTLQVYIELGQFFSFSLLLIYLIIGIIAYKKGLIRHGPRRRRFAYPVTSGLTTGLVIMIVWRVLTGPLPLYSLLIFALIVVFVAFLSDQIWKRLDAY